MPTYYVSTTGNDSNTGITPSDAIKTFTRLTQLLQAGDIAYIAPGTYPVSVHGKFNPINNTSITSPSAQMTIIGDTTGVVFGVSPGEVVIDAQNNGSVNIVNISASWSGCIVFKNLKIKDVRVNSSGVVGGVIVVPQNNFNAVQVQFDNCVFTNIQMNATAPVDGLFAYCYFNNTYSHLLLRDCTIGLGTTSNDTSAVFSLHSAITGNADTTSPSESHQVKLVNTTIFHEEGATVNSAYHRIFNIGYHLGAATYTSAGQLRVLLKGVTIRPKSTNARFYGLFAEHANGGVSFDIEDSNINIRNMDSWDGQSHSVRYFNIRRSVLNVILLALPAYSSTVAEQSKFVVESSFNNKDHSNLYAEKCFFVNFPNASPILYFNYMYATVLFVDTVFSGFHTINISGTSKTSSFKRCLFVNCGANQQTSSVSCVIDNMNQTSQVVDSTVLKVHPSANTFYISSTTPGFVFFQNIFASRFALAGTTNYASFNYNIQTISSNLSERPFVPLPDVVVPEFDAPITGKQSALIPVACIGRGKFRVLLEGGRPNTISLVLQKSWTGGKVEFWIENTKLNATVANVTTPQTINITVTPEKSGAYELEIFGYDAVDQLTFTTNYQPNSIKVDSVIVS